MIPDLLLSLLAVRFLLLSGFAFLSYSLSSATAFAFFHFSSLAFSFAPLLRLASGLCFAGFADEPLVLCALLR
jgi:hypothetical protein